MEKAEVYGSLLKNVNFIVQLGIYFLIIGMVKCTQGYPKQN